VKGSGQRELEKKALKTQISEQLSVQVKMAIPPKEKLDLLQAEVVSYRKIFNELEKVYGQIVAGTYGAVDERAQEALREELDAGKNLALRYDVLLERSPASAKTARSGGERFSASSDN
jgi:hypothetical protein